MGYFSNGTEGEMYQERWCSRCVRDKEEGCPVWIAHLLYSYQLCNSPEDPGKVMLDMLIPREGIYNGQCAMFSEGGKR